MPSTGDRLTDTVVAAGVRVLRSLGSADAGDQLFVGGSSNMATAFDAVETVRSVLTILEQQLVVVTLLRDILDTGLSVAIGTEHGVEPLASCAIVVMPVSVDGVETGTIGLLGPTRMNYPLALAAARVVGDRLGERLSEVGPAAGSGDLRDHRRPLRGAGRRAGTRPRRSSSGPTGPRPASTTPTPTTAMPRPRSGSRR